MKKGFMKKAAALGLSAVMALSLAACGKDGNGGGGNGGGGGNANSSLAKQYVFSYEEIDMGDLGDSVDIRDMVYVNDRVYVLLNIYEYGGSGEGAAMMRGTVGGAVALPETAVDDDAAVDGGEGSDEPAAEPRNVTKVVSFKTDGSDVQSFELQMGDEASSNSYINSITFGGDGQIYAVREVYIEDYSDPENPIYENRQEFLGWNSDGSLKWTKPLDELKGDSDYFYISNMMATADGSIHMLINGDTSKLISFDGDGNKTGEKELSSNAMQNAGNIFMKSDGTLFMTSYNDDWTKMYASTYDPQTDTEVEKVELPGNLSNYSMYKGTTTDLVLTNNSGIYTYNIGEADIKQIMSYVNSDLAANYMQRIVMIDDEHFVGAYPDGVDYQTKVSLFTKVDPKDIPDKSVIVLGANWLDTEVKQHIIDFNKTNSKYRITLKDYSTYNTMEDYMAGYTQLNNDIISGNMPDILVADNQMPVGNYIAKGLIADIGSLIEKDEELSKVEFLDNVFRAYSINDKLYYVVPNFSVGTVIGKTSILGDMQGWTMEEMQQLLDAQPEGTSSFGDMTRSSFFYYIMRYCGSQFIDQSTGKCNFNSQEFMNLLEFAKTLPEEINYDYDNYDWNSYETQYRENRTILMPTSIYSVKDMNYTINGTFGEDVTFIGFPNENRNGSVISANLSFVLSSKSKVLDGAWEFVRYYLSEDYQKSSTWGMSVNKQIFLDKAQEALQRPYYTDENGEKVEYDESYFLNGEEIKLPPMSQEQIDEIVNFVQSVDRCVYYNESVQKIIDEETAAFFAGQKTAAEVSQIIQSRAQIYVDENR